MLKVQLFSHPYYTKVWPSSKCHVSWQTIFCLCRYDDESDESNFEAFDDESPLLQEGGEKHFSVSGTDQIGSRKGTGTSELGDFDNRRFFR